MAPAVPVALLNATVNPPCTALADVTVNVKVFVPPVPSVTVGLLIANVCESSLLMVPVAEPSVSETVSLPPLSTLKLAVKVS